jgi:hypothetical protein
MKKVIVIGLVIFVAACHLTKKPQLDCTTIPASYKNDIAPIITNNCMPCHKAGSLKGDWTTYEGLKSAATSGDLEKRVLVKQDMPPKAPLADSLRKKIRCWLNNGALNN